MMFRSPFTIVFCTALICFMGFGASSLKAVDRESAFPNGVFAPISQFDTPENLNGINETTIAPPGPVLYFSPRYPITLMYNWIYFYLRDADLAYYTGMGSNFMQYFNGSYFGMRNLDAVDIVMDSPEPEFNGEPVGGCIYFSVRDDQLLSDANNNSFYMHKEDIAVYDPNSGMFHMILEGKQRGILGIDALSVMYDEGAGAGYPDKLYVFSTTVDSYLSNGPGEPALFCRDEDLVMYDPNTNKFTMFLHGLEDIGIGTLDGVDIIENYVYFSVKEPAYVNQSPMPSVYLKDGDVGVFDLNTQYTTKYFEGKYKGVQSIDALSLVFEEPLNR